MAHPAPDRLAPDDDILRHVVRQVVAHCLDRRDRDSFAQSIGISPALHESDRAEALADLYLGEPRIRARLSRLLTSATRESLEQVRLSSEIELEQLVEKISLGKPDVFWATLWALIQDGRDAARALALTRVRDLLPQRQTVAEAAPGAASPAASPASAPAASPTPASFPVLGTRLPSPQTDSPPRSESLSPIPPDPADPPGPRSMSPGKAEAPVTPPETETVAAHETPDPRRTLREPAEMGLASDSLAVRALGNLETVLDGVTARQREIRGLLLSEMDALRNEIRTLVSLEEESRRSLSALAARVVALSNEVKDTRLREALDRIEGNINQLMSANRRLEASIAPRDETLRAMLDNLKSGQGETLRNAAEVNSRMDDLAGHITGALAPLSQLTETHERALDERLQRLEAPLQQMSRAVDDLQARLDARDKEDSVSASSPAELLEERLNHLEAQILNLSNRLDAVGEAVHGARDELGRLEAGRKESEARLSQAITRAAAQPEETELHEIREQVASLGNVLGEIRAEQHTVHDMLARLGERVDSGEVDTTVQAELLERLRTLHERVSAIGQGVLRAMPGEPTEATNECETDLRDPSAAEVVEAVAATAPVAGDPHTPEEEGEPEPAPEAAADERLQALVDENRELRERCAALERCLDEASRQEMDRILEEEAAGETHAAQVEPGLPLAEPDAATEAPDASPPAESHSGERTEPALDMADEAEIETSKAVPPPAEDAGTRSAFASPMETRSPPDLEPQTEGGDEASGASDHVSEVGDAPQGDHEELLDPEDDLDPLAAFLAGLDDIDEVDAVDKRSETPQAMEPDGDETRGTPRVRGEAILDADDGPGSKDHTQDIDSAWFTPPASSDATFPDESDSIHWMDNDSEDDDLTGQRDSSTGAPHPAELLYNDELIVMVGGKKEYDQEYRSAVTELGARLERYPSLDTLDQNQINDLVARSDVLVLIGDSVTTVGGFRARRSAGEAHRRCFSHPSAHPRSLRRFLRNLVLSGQV